MDTTGQATINIKAAAPDIYALISDLSRMGDWSPECYRTELHEPGIEIAPGATFQGYNRSGFNWWNVPCKVTTAEPGRHFEFEAPTGMDAATSWSFELTSDGDTTTLTERFNAPMLAMPDTPPGQDPARRDHLIAALGVTLDRIKRAAESGS